MKIQNKSKKLYLRVTHIIIARNNISVTAPYIWSKDLVKFYFEICNNKLVVVYDSNLLHSPGW